MIVESDSAARRRPGEVVAPVGPGAETPPAPTRRLLARLLLVVAAGALLASPLYPYWTLKLLAPQYPGGLYLTIHPHHVRGDVGEVDALNHYIGMRKISEAAALERRLGVPAIVVMAVCLVAAAAWGSRWTSLLAVPTILFPLVFVADLYWWLRDSGLGLDPKAALSSSIKPFVPQILGVGKIGQFRTVGSFGAGYYLCVFAGLAAIVYVHQSILFCPMRALWRRLRAKSGRAAALAAAAVVAAGLSTRSAAATLIVAPGGSPATLAEALDLAAPGDTVEVQGGVHPGPVVVGKSLRLVGKDRPVIDGGGRGSVVRLEAPDCVLRGFTIRSSGDLLASEDVGVLVGASGVLVEDNQLEDVLFGIYLRRAPRSAVRGNTLHGKNLSVARRGDLIRLWYSDDVTIEGNSTLGGRDVVLWYSNRLKIQDNRISGGRYGLHFMYCDDADVTGNRLSENSVGAFLMYSRRLRLEKNWIVDNRGVSGYGIGLKDMDDSHVAANVLSANKVGLFLEHSRGLVRENLVAGNDKGVVLFPSAQGNRFEDNSFVENGSQVEIEGFRDTMTTNTWRGNYWSDYRGYDVNGDGMGDLAYRPSRLFERIADNSPSLRLFADSPSAQAIDFAAGVFPIFEPKPKFADESPRMRPLPAPVVMAGIEGSWQWFVLGAAFLSWPVALAVGKTLVEEASPPSSRLTPVRTDSDADTVLISTLIDDVEPAAAVVVSNLTKRFGKAKAVADLSFAVSAGETVALWGPNGAGKTTVLRCLLGLLPFEGSLTVMGRPCGPRGRESRQAVGYVPQEVRLHADDTVRDTVRFYSRLRGVAVERGERLLDEWGLGDVGRRPVRHLSGGMKQKLALIVALLADPPVLLLDEPTSNLDARTRREFAELLMRLKAVGKTLLFCTHRPSEVWKLADRVVVLEQGRKLAEGTPEQVRLHLATAIHLGLVVAGDQAAAAAETLRGHGFAVDRTGSRLWIDVGTGRKVEAVERLRQAGVPVLDFDLETDHSSPGVAETNGDGVHRR
jgi:nitrous oxidase accessory protein